MNYSSYNPSYSLHSGTPEPLARSTPSPPPPSNSHRYLPSLPIPLSSSPAPYNNSSNNLSNNSQSNQFQRQIYPTSSPYPQAYQYSPDPSPNSTSSRLPRPTFFTDGYASPATSSYSSEPGSRDEIDLMEPGTLGGSPFHGTATLPGVDAMFRHGYFDKHVTRSENPDNRRLNMKEVQLVQTVGTGTFGRVFLARFVNPTPKRPEFFALKVTYFTTHSLISRFSQKQNVCDYDR